MSDRDRGQISVTALYVLSKLEEHAKICERRWATLIKLVICGFGGLTLGMAGIIIALLRHL